MQLQEESFLAFFSYVQENDRRDRGKLTFLRKSLQDEIWVQTGKRFRIFQDVENLEWGQNWKERIKNILDESSMFIAIVTPGYLESPFCRFEFEYFLKQETPPNNKLILPILYIDTPELDNKNDNIAVEISKRQWRDWRDLRFATPTSAKVNKKLESLAKQIRKLIEGRDFRDKTKAIASDYPLPEAKLREPASIESSNQLAGKLPILYAPINQKWDLVSPLKTITILLHPTSDRERDKRRIRIVHSTLISFYGHDRFSFQLFHEGKAHLIDFPNDTTRICPELLARLKKLMGEESWRIEEITFQ